MLVALPRHRGRVGHPDPQRDSKRPGHARRDVRLYVEDVGQRRVEQGHDLSCRIGDPREIPEEERCKESVLLIRCAQ